MAVLAELGLRGISLAEAVRYRKREGAWPKNVVVMTFDDGYANVHEHALPALREFEFSATVFVVTGHVGLANDWAPPLERLGLQPLMTWSQIDDLVKAGLEIGAHTVTHPDLRRLDEQAVKREIADSRQSLEDKLQHRISTFAYPFGWHTEYARRIVGEAFDAACTTELRRASYESLEALPRLDTYYLQQPDDFRRAVMGKLDRYLAIRRWGRSVRAVFREK